MNSQKSFDFELVGLAKLLSSYTLKIPHHQRDYSWTLQEVDRLLDDLAVAKDKHHDYFLGTIVTTLAERNEPLEVVDGQQRLTTTYMILASIRDYLIKIEGRKNFKDKLAINTINNLDNAILNTPSRKSGKIPRLTLNVVDAEFFRNLTTRSVDTKKLNPTNDSHDLLLDANLSIRKWIVEVVSTVKPKDISNILESWVSYLESDAQVVLLKASDGTKAFRMFETLNDRGLKTTQADLVKNYLFGESGDKLQEAQFCWSTMLDNLHDFDEKDRSVTFLRHLLIATRQFVRADDVYEVIQNTIRKSESITFLTNLKTYSSIYVSTFQPNSEYWNDYPTKAKKALIEFNRFNLKPLRPLVFSLAERFDKDKFSDAIEFLANLSVRLVVASQTRSGANEQAFASASLKVFNKEITTLGELKKSLASVTPTDSEFEAAFSKAKSSKQDFSRYYLRVLESTTMGDPEPHFLMNDDESQITLEHILPKNPKNGDWTSLLDEDIRRYKTRIGNLCLLQKSANSAIGNRCFEDKKATYKASDYKLTKMLSNESHWGPEEIDNRQAHLAKLAIRAWKI